MENDNEVREYYYNDVKEDPKGKEAVEAHYRLRKAVKKDRRNINTVLDLSEFQSESTKKKQHINKYHPTKEKTKYPPPQKKEQTISIYSLLEK